MVVTQTLADALLIASQGMAEGLRIVGENAARASESADRVFAVISDRAASARSDGHAGSQGNTPFRSALSHQPVSEGPLHATPNSQPLCSPSFMDRNPTASQMQVVVAGDMGPRQDYLPAPGSVPDSVVSDPGSIKSLLGQPHGGPSCFVLTFSCWCC